MKRKDWEAIRNTAQDVLVFVSDCVKNDENQMDVKDTITFAFGGWTLTRTGKKTWKVDNTEIESCPAIVIAKRKLGYAINVSGLRGMSAHGLRMLERLANQFHCDTLEAI